MQDATLLQIQATGQSIRPVSLFSFPHREALNDKEYVTFPVIFRWSLVLFAYGWFLVLILPFTLFDSDLLLSLRLQSIPFVFVSLTLAILFQGAMNQLRYGLAALFALGLIVAGALA